VGVHEVRLSGELSGVFGVSFVVGPGVGVSDSGSSSSSVSGGLPVTGVVGGWFSGYWLAANRNNQTQTHCWNFGRVQIVPRVRSTASRLEWSRAGLVSERPDPPAVSTQLLRFYDLVIW
jgi:hypothetical protein